MNTLLPNWEGLIRRARGRFKPKKFQADALEQGQGLVEYALILVLVAVVVIAVLGLAGNSISGIFCQVLGTINRYHYSCNQCRPMALSAPMDNGAKDILIDYKDEDQVSIFIQERPGFDPIVTVYNPSDTQIAQDDNSGGGQSALVSFDPTVTGTYRINVANVGGGYSSDFTGYQRCPD
jgi:pilus assembly protein Flp/PilA